jgi:prepilin-type N-terminal cleavage/methylation domain-containing protein
MILRRSIKGFTLVEMLVSITVLALIVLLVSRLFNSASAVTASGNKRMDSDGQVRPLLDRIAIDFAQMVKRSDVDYYLKSSSNSQTGNDQIAFYGAVPGYNTATASPVSLVAYRINARNQAERMAKGLIWNGDSSPGIPIVFLPLTIAATWTAATNNATDPDYELIAANVFRFEYYYVLKNGTASDTPWDSSAGHTAPNGMQDVNSISVAMAAIDPKSRVLLSDAQVITLIGGMNDFASSMAPGELASQWQTSLDDTTNMPRPAIAGIRIYQRHFQLTR